MIQWLWENQVTMMWGGLADLLLNIGVTWGRLWLQLGTGYSPCLMLVKVDGAFVQNLILSLLVPASWQFCMKKYCKYCWIIVWKWKCCFNIRIVNLNTLYVLFLRLFFLLVFYCFMLRIRNMPIFKLGLCDTVIFS